VAIFGSDGTRGNHASVIDFCLFSLCIDCCCCARLKTINPEELDANPKLLGVKLFSRNFKLTSAFLMKVIGEAVIN